MRARAETLLITALAAFAFAGVTAVIFHNLDLSSHPSVVLVDPIEVPPALIEPVTVAPVAANPEDAGAWFQSVRQSCNAVEVETRLRWQPAPATEDGVVREAACYALAGKIDLARTKIESLPQDRRHHAAGFVFDTGHPVADAGDDVAAGPLMELVVEYWPNHYMALYHAGAASFERGEQERARGYLERFLVEYTAGDGWTASARSMLTEIAAVTAGAR